MLVPAIGSCSWQPQPWWGARLSSVATQLQAQQSACSGAKVYLELPNHGLGSDLHIWATAVCNAFETNATLVAVPSRGLRCSDCVPYNGNTDGKMVARLSVPSSYSDGLDSNPCGEHKAFPGRCVLASVPPWAWEGLSSAPRDVTSADVHHTPLVSTFGVGVNPCAASRTAGESIGQRPMASLVHASPCDPLRTRAPCALSSRCGKAHIEPALNVLFANLSPHILTAAHEAMRELFGGRGEPPKNLITVHIRWGDKWKEGKLFQGECYVRAVERLLTMQHRAGTNALAHPDVAQRAPTGDDEPVHIFVTTEDLAALDAFNESAHRRGHLDWRVHTWMPAVLQDSRGAWGVTDLSPLGAARLQAISGGHRGGGAVGARTPRSPLLESLVALLIGVEAQLFVLSMRSNWSRLIHELRRLRWRAGPECPKGWRACTKHEFLVGSNATC